MRARVSRLVLTLGLAAALGFTFACGPGSNSSSGQSQNNGNNGGGSPSNVAAVTVNSGPASIYVDGAFTSVTVCSPGTTNCQTISGILVDTGSFGLRILSSALTITLPPQTDSSGNPMAECAAFGSGITWGPVQTADIKIAGEAASAVPIQVIGSSNFATIPSDCSPAQGLPMDDLASLGANGLLGIGQSIQDCGPDCANSGPLSQGTYFSCPASGCTDTTESLARQVQNPVAFFATDNNGVILELPAVTGAEAGVSGSLIFGIGTQSNNGLGGATVFGTDQFGNFSTTYKNTPYPSFLDSGSNGIYFLDHPTTGILVCSDITFLYCPATTETISVVNNAQAGTNGASAPASFGVANADSLVNQGNNAAINGLAGPLPGMFDFGLPFFFGRNVYSAIVGKSTPGGTGPYIAY